MTDRLIRPSMKQVKMWYVRGDVGSEAFCFSVALGASHPWEQN